MIDCHNHLQDERLSDSIEQIVIELRSRGVNHWVVNGTCPQDWERVARLAEQYEEVRPCFGLHPWKLNERTPGWETELREFLEKFPLAGVGEFGLDKWMRNPDLQLQEEAFRKQWQLAIELKRPAMIHCLRAFGKLKNLLQTNHGNTPFLLHSYSGPKEMMTDFVELGAYFSLSGYFFRPEKREKLEVFRTVPKKPDFDRNRRT